MAEVNLAQFLAARLRGAAKDLHNAAKKMPAERIAWHPAVEGNNGRDALDQVLECAYLNEWGAKAFLDGAVPQLDNDDYKARQDANRNADAAQKWLTEGTEKLAQAVESRSAAQLGESMINPFTKQPSNFAEFADFFYWNTVYHEGQVNYIQVLYGDMS